MEMVKALAWCITPGYDFNDEILPIGATYWVKMAEEILSPID